jgi:hypothetical protein
MWCCSSLGLVLKYERSTSLRINIHEYFLTMAFGKSLAISLYLSSPIYRRTTPSRSTPPNHHANRMLLLLPRSPQLHPDIYQPPLRRHLPRRKVSHPVDIPREEPTKTLCHDDRILVSRIRDLFRDFRLRLVSPDEELVERIISGLSSVENTGLRRQGPGRV